MAVEVVIEDARRISKVEVKASTTILRGQILGYNSGWVLADADVGAGPIFGQWIAMEGGSGGQTIPVCKECVLYDGDAPYTANTSQYLSGTAGGITETRPGRGVGNLIQVVGRSLDTYRTTIKLDEPKEFTIFLSPDTFDGTGEPGLGLADAGWVGPQVDGTEATYYKGSLPENLVGSIITARHLMNSINGSAADLDYSIVGAYDGTAAAGASNVQDTGTAITTTDWEQADADNKILTVDISALFDAGFYMPGRTFCILCDPDGVTADVTMLGVKIVGFCV